MSNISHPFFNKSATQISRQTSASTTPSHAQRHSHVLPLEIKLELLEARFTQPSRKATAETSQSGFSLGSHQTFSFDNASMTAGGLSSSSKCETPDKNQTLPPQRPAHTSDKVNPLETLHRHIAKMEKAAFQAEASSRSNFSGATLQVASSSSVAVSPQQSSRLSSANASASSMSEVSQATPVTSHIKGNIMTDGDNKYTDQESSRTEVAGVSTSPRAAKQSTLSGHLLPIATSKGNKEILSANKRKSVPIKREFVSVKENFVSDIPIENEGEFSSHTAYSGANKSTTEDITIDASNVTTNRIVKKRSREVIDKQSPSLLTPTRDIKPTKHRKLHQSSLQPSQSQAPRPSVKNCLINDFFKSTVKTKKSVHRNNTDNKQQNMQIVPSPATATAILTDNDNGKEKSATLIDTDNTEIEESTNPTQTTAMDALRQRYAELQRQYQDKEAQLQAVSNNRTILHSNLQAALNKREAELARLQNEHKLALARRDSVMEKLIRKDATRQGIEHREKLAAEAARLGKIAYTRVGMRTVETWEDGYASKKLREKKKELHNMKSILQKRLEIAHEAAKQFQIDISSHEKCEAKLVELVDDLRVRTRLEAIEAVASVEHHLLNLKREVAELEQEEQNLKEEKIAHLRSSNRIACEDSSRFQSCPKLHDRYILQNLLGKGGFSEVWRAFDLVQLREVAVKIHQLDPRWPDAKKENYTKHVSREYEIHRNVRHPRIVSLYDVFEIDNNSFGTVLECCNGKDLDSLLKEKKRLPELEARPILLQILLGMQYLSQSSADGNRPGIIHYDLKPGNILFDEFGDAKITDFGLSKIAETMDSAESMELTSQGAGTYWYLPPECFVTTESVRISNKVDVFSIGVIFFQMLFGSRPFGDGQSQEKLLTDHTMLNAHEVRFPGTPVVSDACKEFIRACLTYEQADRPTMLQLCEHPYIQEPMQLEK